MDTFAEVVRSRAADDKTAVLFEGRQRTWAELVRESAERAAALKTLPTAGDRPLHVGLLLENTPDFITWLFAAALTGSVMVGINSTRRGEELAGDIRHTDCDLLVTDDRLAGLVDGLDTGIAPERVFNVDSASYQDFLAPFRGAALPADLPDPKAILLLMFSSGSTGAPKAVICSNGRLGFLARSLSERARLRRDSVTHLSMPLFHGNALMLNLAPSAYLGATMCLVRRFSASGFVRDLHEHKITYMNYVGRALSYILAVPVDPRDRDSSLEFALGTEASVADVEHFAARFGCEVSEGYGMSEGMLRINRSPDSPPDSIGLPVAGADVRVMNEETGEECPRAVIDPSGRLLNADEATGQLVAVGRAAAFEGYYKNPQAMADRIRGDDFWTGDLAYRDADGYFYFAGRSSDWMRVDSENFAAGPIERIIGRWHKAAVAVVYAVPDPRTGDQVMCTVQMAEGCGFDPDEFTAFLDAQPDLGTKWRPRFVRVVDEMPTTGNNKVARAGLRRAGWYGTEPVYWRDGADARYRLLDEQARDDLAAEFVRHGRTALLPQPV